MLKYNIIYLKLFKIVFVSRNSGVQKAILATGHGGPWGCEISRCDGYYIFFSRISILPNGAMTWLQRRMLMPKSQWL
jgi:hypothetical protein